MFTPKTYGNTDSSKMEACWPFRLTPFPTHAGIPPFPHWKEGCQPSRMFRSSGSASAMAIPPVIRLMDETDARCYPQVVPSPCTGGKMGAPFTKIEDLPSYN